MRGKVHLSMVKRTTRLLHYCLIWNASWAEQV